MALGLVADAPLDLDAVGHVAADEEELLLGHRPNAGPPQRHDMPVLVDVAALEIALSPVPSCGPHLVPDGIEVSGIDERPGIAADELVRAITENLFEARADADEIALT